LASTEGFLSVRYDYFSRIQQCDAFPYADEVIFVLNFTCGKTKKDIVDHNDPYILKDTMHHGIQCPIYNDFMSLKRLVRSEC
jgi:hypothetical protein